MGAFRDSEEVYAPIGRLFEEIVADLELGPRVQQADTVVQYRLTEPDALITVKIKKGQERRVDLGETELAPEVVMTMEADTAHRFWLGGLSVTMAMTRGEIIAKGPVAKILRLVPLVKPAFPRYLELLAESGRSDLSEPEPAGAV
jgi:hypothetical protein